MNLYIWDGVKTAIRGIFLALVVAGPLIVGLPLTFGEGVRPVLLGAVLGFLLAVLWILSGSSSERAHKIVYVVVSVFLSVTLVDVIARPLVGSSISPGRIISWPPMPLVQRYAPHVRFYTPKMYGEMARPASMARYREYREMRFVTDRFGFRNEGTVNEPLDVIVLGDSYAMGDDTTQERTWSTLLSTQYGLHVYNLAVGGDGPWTEFTNLSLEIDRLRLKPRGTVVLWLLYTGNDLEDICYPIFQKDELPWQKGLAGLKGSFRAYRNASPLGHLRARIKGAARWEDIAVKRFLDGTDIIFSTSHAREAALNVDAVRNSPHYGCIKQTIAAMRHLAESKNLTVAIMVAPPAGEVYSWVLRDGRPWSTPSSPSGFAAAMREIARAERMPFLDLKPLLVAASKRVYEGSGHLLWWRDDTHWNVDGNREVAGIAYEFYRSLITGTPAPGDQPKGR